MRPNVLVVEDEGNIRELVSLHLRLEEMTPVEAADGQTGLDAARTTRFDLVILDLMLPQIDGVTATPPTPTPQSSCSPRDARSPTKCSDWTAERTTT